MLLLIKGARAPLLQFALLVPMMLPAACATDDASDDGTTSATGSATTGGESGLGTTGGGVGSSSDGADSSGGPSGPPAPDDTPPCDANLVGTAIPAAAYVSIVSNFSHSLPTEHLTGICPGLETIAGGTLEVRMYRPGLGIGLAWPEAAVPLVVHHHAGGRTYTDYDAIGNRLAELGYVVLSVRASASSTADGRKEAVACAMSWLASPDSQGGVGGAGLSDGDGGDTRLRCDAIMMGHSQGARAAARFVEDREDEQFSLYWFGFEPAALVGFAPVSTIEEVMTQEPWVPTLAFGAGFDGNAGNPVAFYDRNPPEEARLGVGGPGANEAPARELIWVQSASHFDFAGANPSLNAGIAAVVEYLPRFLQWQVQNDNEADNRRVLHFQTFPESLNNPSHHAGVDSYGDPGFRPCSAGNATGCNATVGCVWDTGSCTELDCNDTDHADPSDCEATVGCVDWDGGCVDRPALYGAYTVDTTAGAQVQAVEYFPSTGQATLGGSLSAVGQVSTGDVLADFMSDFTGTTSGHETEAMLVTWGPNAPSTPAGSVSLAEVNAAEVVGGASHLSFRIGNLATISDCGSTPTPASTEPLTIGVRLRSQDQENAVPTYFDTPLIPAQRSHTQFGSFCVEQTMTTVRIPMSAFCNDEALDPGQALDTSKIDQIDFFFDDHGIDRNVIIDTIEFTGHNLDYTDINGGLNICGLGSGAFACPATSTLAAAQTSCSGEPISGACPSADVVSTSVAIPESHDGTNPFDGWLVHAHPGVIADINNLSTSDLEFVQERCIRACESHWGDDPFVDANCDATGAFGTPYLVSTDSVGTWQAIPEAQLDGSDLFAGQSLAGSLHHDACLEFDEPDICRSTPARVTPAREPLGRGQEWEMTVTGSTWADSPAAAAEVDADMVGTIGYTHCTEGDGADCAFYIGSLHLELTEDLDLDLDCGAGTESHSITALDFDLVQPAMGIAEATTSYKAFPPRALIVEATGTADGLPIYTRGPIELPIFYQAGQGWALLQGAGGAYSSSTSRAAPG